MAVLALLVVGCSEPEQQGTTPHQQPLEVREPSTKASQSEQEIPLPGEAKRRQIRHNQRHHFGEFLKQDSFLYLRIEQHDVDVRVELSHGTEVLRCVDLRIGSEGVEEIWWVAPQTSRYSLSVIAAGTGSYTVASDRQLRATARQALLSRAQGALSEAMGGHRCAEASALELIQAAALWNESGETWQEALAWAEAGRAAQRLDLEDAVLWLSRALEIFEDLDRPGQQTRVLLRRAQVSKKLGRLRLAAEDLNRAVALADSRGDVRREARGRNDLAVLHLQRGAYEEALFHYDRAAELWRQAGLSVEAQPLNGMAEVFMRLGEMKEARIHLDRALEIASPLHRSRTLMLTGWWHYLEHDAPAALEVYSEALRQVSVHRDPERRAGLFDRMGSAHVQLDQLERAELRYKQALGLMELQGRPLDMAHTLSNLAALSLEQEDATAAGLRYCERAIEIFRRLEDRDSLSQGLWVRARLYAEQDDFHAAARDLAEAVDLLEDLRQSAGPPPFRSSFLASRIQIYQLYLEVLMKLDDLEPENRDWNLMALAASERARARSLLDLLSAAEVEAQDVEEDWLDQERWVNAEIAALESLARTWQKAEIPTGAVHELEDRLRERMVLLHRLRQASQNPHGPLPQPLQVQEISHLLDEDTLILVYGFGSTHAFSWWIDDSGLVGSHLLGEARHLEERAKEWTHLMSETDRSWDWRHRQARALELREMLLAPAAEAISNSSRLVIVGEGALRSLPFAALPAMRTDNLPLITTHEIVYLSSVSALASMRRRIAQRPLAPESLLAVGDPVYDPWDARLQEQLRSEIKAPSDRLRHSSVEVRKILQLAAPDCQTCALLGFDASLARLRSIDLTHYRILHFAAHSKIDKQSPELSGIRLSCFDPMGRVLEENLLHFYDIFDLDLPAELVVLSACSTALGEHVPGEGLVDLGRAFNYAGVPRAVMTLWDVQDESTSILMALFYEGLFQHGLAPSAALRRAQLAMIESDWEPFQWAPFVFQGEWRFSAVSQTDALVSASSGIGS